MEKLKDILYDLGDVLVSLAIIAVIFLIVSWKLNDAFPLQATLFSPDAETTTEIEATSSVVAQSIDLATSESVNTPVDQQQTSSTAQDASQAVTTEAPTANQDVVKKSITIPSGSSGNSIAKLLEQNGLIESRSEFLKVVDKLGVGGRLQAGKFEISSNMSYEEIAKILSGK